ncbi:PEP-CTERM sorting domain-containing protein [Tundrisphaera lichenicola]|uniref:PEP-CTERM sorting domain-containing protein n=1 Tax=Tundrisphaera lichenicola TaxID=2029860 RepID=UPI003EBDA68B
MKTCRSLSLAVAIPLLVAGLASASPITYAFTGTLQAPIQGLNGADQFSGTFTIDGDPTPNAQTGSVYEGGNDVAVTLKIGGQSFTFTNSPTGLSSAEFTAGTSPTWLNMPVGPRQDEITVNGNTSSADAKISFGMSFYNPASMDHLSDLRTLMINLGTGSSYITFGHNSADSYAGGGNITSIGLVPTSTPEPSTLAVFVVLGVVAMSRRRRS